MSNIIKNTWRWIKWFIFGPPKRDIYAEAGGSIHIGSSNRCVSINYREDGVSAVAEASRIGTHLWFVNRCLVNPAAARGKSLGGTVLDKMLIEIRKTDPAGVVIVTPGGYDADPAAQIRFYERHGFVETEPDPGWELLGVPPGEKLLTWHAGCHICKVPYGEDCDAGLHG